MKKNGKKIILAAVIAASLLILSSCSRIVCDEPDIIDYENKECCSDTDKDHKCDSYENNKIEENLSGLNEEADEMDGNFALMKTSKGDIKIELFGEKAPNTVKNFAELVKSGFYDGLTFHRYVPGFVIQGGDPSGDGTGGSGKTIKLEINNELTHIKGAVAMARSSNPDSASSQFYITLADTPHLDGQYAVFGKVTEGMDNVMMLREGDVISSVEIK